jgi:hypothetical protein
MTPVQSQNPDGPVFVIGSMRSGTTLLRLILDSHERIAIGAETGFMGAVAATTAIPGWRYGREWYERIGWTEDELHLRLRGFYSEMFSRHAAQQGKVRWGDKTPFHTAHVALMAEIFPDAVFVGIVRHPGAVVRSLMRTFQYSLDQASRYWLDANSELMRGAVVAGDRFALCRYEDLVFEPEPLTRALMDWLGEEWSPRLLQHEEVQRRQGAPRVVDGGTSTRDAIDAQRATKWIDALLPEQLSVLEETTGTLAEFFGYRASSADRPEPLAGSGASSLVDGRALATRRLAMTGLTLDRSVSVTPGADLEELALRLERAESALSRVRSRRAVVLADSLKRAVWGRSPAELRTVWRALRGNASNG